MATDTDQDRFEEIDWEEVQSGLGLLPPRTMAVLASLGVMAAAILTDRYLVPDGVALFDFGVPLVGWQFTWDVTRLDWLFVLTLLMFVFYAAVPLARNPRMTRYYWERFRRNKAAVASMAYLLVVFTVGTFGPIFMAPPELQITQAYQPPVFTSVGESVPVSCVGPVVEGMCQGTWQYPLGTTQQGKDMVKLMVFGMRVSMQVGLISSLLIITIGTTVGTVAATAGGMVDEVLMRYVDIQLTFPTFFLYLLLVYLFGGSLFLLIVIFGITSWGGVARLVRSEALQRREEEYITAANSAGASTLYVIRRHIVPNVSNTVITATTLLIPSLILAEAGLSFLGLGDPTVPSWGQVISSGRGDLSTAWWVSTIPGFFLFFTILGFNFMGDALRDALDPRSEH